jgi:hypothetical protein
MPRPKGSRNKKVKTEEIQENKISEEKIVSKELTEKEKLNVYIEELKRKDIHQYSVREAELLNKFKQL